MWFKSPLVTSHSPWPMLMPILNPSGRRCSSRSSFPLRTSSIPASRSSGHKPCDYDVEEVLPAMRVLHQAQKAAEERL